MASPLVKARRSIRNAAIYTQLTGNPEASEILMRISAQLYRLMDNRQQVHCWDAHKPSPTRQWINDQRSKAIPSPLTPYHGGEKPSGKGSFPRPCTCRDGDWDCPHQKQYLK